MARLAAYVLRHSGPHKGPVRVYDKGLSSYCTEVRSLYYNSAISRADEAELVERSFGTKDRGHDPAHLEANAGKAIVSGLQSRARVETNFMIF